MPVEIIPVPKPTPGIDFPVNHETYPNNCENVACTKIDGRYQPGTWVIITNKFDKVEEEFIPQEYHVCTMCNKKAKKSFNGMKIFSWREVKPMLKKALAVVHARIDVATLAPLTWVKKPKPEKKKEEKSFIDEIKVMVSHLKPLGLPKPQLHRLPKIKRCLEHPKNWYCKRKSRQRMNAMQQTCSWDCKYNNKWQERSTTISCTKENKNKKSLRKSTSWKNVNENFANREIRSIRN